jgi:peptide/nickel transport system substrate-binding protein
VVYRFVPDASVRVAGLIAGDFDLINNLPPEDFARVPQAVRIDGLFVNFILPNALGGITKDTRVRQALDLAIDKQALAKSLYERYATVAAGQFITKHTFGFNPALQARPYDPAKARQLLREAGAEGATIELVSTAGRWLKDRETTEAVAAYWTQVGLKVNVRMYEFREYLNRLLDRNVRPGSIFVSAADVLLDADRMVSSYLLKDQQFSSSADDAMSARIPQARTELDVSKRQALYNEVLRRAQEEAYIISLLNYEDIYGLSKRTVWMPRPDGQVLIKDVMLR